MAQNDAENLVTPIINLYKFTQGTSEERKEIARTFDDAFRNVGFVLLSNYQHLLSEEVISSLRSEGKTYFALPLQEKEKNKVDGPIGYLGPGAENVAASAGKAADEPDPVESLNLSAYQEKTWCASNAHAECPWQNESYVPKAKAFRDTAVDYFAGATKVMTELMRLSELALNLPPNYFDEFFERPGTLLRVAWYPPTKKQQLRYGAHTDYDGFTILQRHEGDDGLEIQVGAQWVPIVAPANTLTINIGDLLARWTNDRWSSTKHRVAQSATPEGRLSIVYFTGPHPEAMVECLPSCLPENSKPKYEPITAFEHVQAKMKAATQD